MRKMITMSKSKELIRNMSEDPFNIKKLQNKILEIELYFDEFCKNNNIKYFLMGGSALGAMRHKGFIPWDDDLDVFMDYENYQKLMNCVNKIDETKFHFQKQDSYEEPYYFSKIRMNGTTFLDEFKRADRNIHQGIFIDIMCLYNVPSSKLLQKIQFYEAALLKAKAVQVYGYHTDSTKKKIQLFIANILVNKFTKKIIYKDVCKYSKKKTEYLGHFFGRAKFSNSIYKKEWFTEQRMVPFETVELPVCNGVEEYLTTRYGKHYMEMPSEETKRQYQSHAAIWDVNKDYKEYINEKI